MDMMSQSDAIERIRGDLYSEVDTYDNGDHTDWEDTEDIPEMLGNYNTFYRRDLVGSGTKTSKDLFHHLKLYFAKIND